MSKKALTAAGFFFLAAGLHAAAVQPGIGVQWSLAALAQVPLRAYTALLSFLLALLAMILFAKGRRFADILLSLSLLAVVAREILSIYTLSLQTAALGPILDLASTAVSSIPLILFGLEEFKLFRPKLYLPLTGALFAAAVIAAFTADESVLAAEGVVMQGLCAMVFAVLAFTGFSARERERRGETALLSSLYACLSATHLFLFAARAIPTKWASIFGGVPALVFSFWTVVFFFSEFLRTRASIRRTKSEQADKEERDKDVAGRILDGKALLERRNAEITKLAGKLLESAQKQAFTIGKLVGSIDKGGSAEARVVAKEKDILGFTERVDVLITDFNSQIQDTVTEMEELYRRSNAIRKAVSQIIGIAEKTHMLSLNASIEASKAGEAGMGFSVVAKEIRKLAELTRTVSDNVGSVIKDTNRGVEKGVMRIKGLGSGFLEIMEASEEIRTMIADNSKALDEMTGAHREIQDGLAGVDSLIKSILEVSHDMRLMTDRMATAFSWLDESLRLRGEATRRKPDSASYQA